MEGVKGGIERTQGTLDLVDHWRVENGAAQRAEGPSRRHQVSAGL